MFSPLKHFLPFLITTLFAVSCTSLHHQPQAPEDGTYTMKDCQPLPVNFLRRAFSPPTTLPSQLQPYIDYWAKAEIPDLTPKSFNQARGMLHRLAAEEGTDDSQRKTIDTLALQLEHAARMFDVAFSISQPLKDEDAMTAAVQKAQMLIDIRKRFPELAAPALLQEELANADCMLQEFAKQFDGCDPARLPLVSWRLQSASSFKKANEALPDDLLPSGVACLSTAIDLYNDQSDTFIHFRALPKGTSVLVNGSKQSLPPEAANGTFRLQLPSYDMADGRAEVTLLIHLPMPKETLFAPWLSQRQQ